MGAFLASGILSGIGSYFAGQDQAAAYKQAATDSNNTLKGVYGQVQSQEMPYTSAGNNAVSSVSNDLQNGTGFAKSFNLNDFYSDPGYQFQLQQGTNAVNNSAAAKGGLLSGGALKNLASYTTGLASQTYGQAYDRYLQNRQQGYNELMGVAGLGQSAQNQVNNANLTTGTQEAKNTYDSTVGAGNARAAGLMGLTGGISSGISSLGQYYMSQNQNGRW